MNVSEPLSVDAPSESLPPEMRDGRLMRAMFHRVAPRYDFITTAFSYGMDAGWKCEAVEKAALPPGALVLDLACGTADFSFLVKRKLPDACCVPADLTLRMLLEARRRGAQRLTCADAMRLPFADGHFDAVFVGYGLRNFPVLEDALREIRRVLKPGGMLVSLDFFLPERHLLRVPYLAYLYLQGAFWGTVLHGHPRTYTYIPDSLRSFVSCRGLSRLFARTGYKELAVRRFIFGGIALHWAMRRD